ncbi:hypothetical protein FW774_04340 (plasmid) [Pedobacter sp. BS3]|uniref:NUMOD4 motif-containing HNH endonuclease n=1 Tax=Pedobacter sp. BS3 TaxID=2567937 RepID=UPI0011EDE207|nr:NUMOD4 motif-containing HNH endonuclease [Pedobacter sp. BS3]TZF86284.1 hypothetical protein FW774_04340 [Pedobacter sp. BS3]
MKNGTGIQQFAGEIWKPVKFDLDCTNEKNIEISNYGRVKSSTKIAKERLLEGSRQGGYKIIRLKLFRARDAETQEYLAGLKAEIAKQKKQLALTEKAVSKQKTPTDKLTKQLEADKKQLETATKKYYKAYKADERKRTINVGLLVHRLVAEYFLEKPSPEHNLVIHHDFNKLNNHVDNLQWVTQAESSAHQQNSPAVIADKKNRPGRRPENSKVYKLTPTRVMLIKKKIAQGKSLRSLSKQFKVTETQLLRIKRGENWKDIPAAT